MRIDSKASVHKEAIFLPHNKRGDVIELLESIGIYPLTDNGLRTTFMIDGSDDTLKIGWDDNDKPKQSLSRKAKSEIAHIHKKFETRDHLFDRRGDEITGIKNRLDKLEDVSKITIGDKDISVEYLMENKTSEDRVRDIIHDELASLASHLTVNDRYNKLANQIAEHLLKK